VFFFIFFVAGGAAAQSFTLTAKNTSLTIDATTGARIVSLKLDGMEILGSSRIHPRFYGSSLWLSPENKWKGMGPLDAAPYTVESKTALILKSQPDTIRGFSFTKEFRVSEADTSFIIHYTITNIASAIQEVAPWEVTRVPTGGLAFFPAGDQPALTKSDLPVNDRLGIVWYPYDSISKNHQKLFRHGAEGWTAYVKEGIVFIKLYPVIAPGAAAPGEENVEMYANPEKTYIELENQGVYQRLPPNGSLQYEVKWMARRLPAAIGAGLNGHAGTTMDDRALINWVRSLVNRSQQGLNDRNRN